jgi:hypothetical protein
MADRRWQTRKKTPPHDDLAILTPTVLRPSARGWCEPVSPVPKGARSAAPSDGWGWCETVSPAPKGAQYDRTGQRPGYPIPMYSRAVGPIQPCDDWGGPSALGLYAGSVPGALPQAVVVPHRWRLRLADLAPRRWRSRGATPRCQGSEGQRPGQGNALGIRFQCIRGLKARPNRAAIGADLRPLVCMRVRFLGRCPRLSWCRTGGA